MGGRKTRPGGDAVKMQGTEDRWWMIDYDVGRVGVAGERIHHRALVGADTAQQAIEALGAIGLDEFPDVHVSSLVEESVDVVIYDGALVS